MVDKRSILILAFILLAFASFVIADTQFWQPANHNDQSIYNVSELNMTGNINMFEGNITNITRIDFGGGGYIVSNSTTLIIGHS